MSYAFEIIDRDGIESDYSDATFVVIKETMDIEELRKRQKLGLIPEFIPYVPIFNPPALLPPPIINDYSEWYKEWKRFNGLL